MFFKELKQQTHLPSSPLHSNTPLDQMIQCYRKWKEQISTSPSLRHLGYYKCLITSDGNEQNPTMKALTLSILQVHNTILNSSVT